MDIGDTRVMWGAIGLLPSSKKNQQTLVYFAGFVETCKRMPQFAD